MVNYATIYDVAAQAGVSISTVSQTLNRPERVNPRTRNRVLQAIEDLEYVPKAVAVSHARRGFGRIGVLGPFTAYDSYRRRLTGVLAQCKDASRDVVVFDHESAAATVSPLLRTLPVTGRLDGLLIMGLPLDDALTKRLAQRRVQVVLVDSGRPELSSVNVDDEEGGALVARHLLQRGHTDFAFVQETQKAQDFRSQARQRFAGFCDAVAEAGVGRARPRLVATGNDIAGGRQALRSILDRRGPPPTAIFAHHDLLAAGLVLEARSRGLGVPQDLAIVGFDDGVLAEALGLTTVRQPFEESGRIGAKLLCDLLAGTPISTQHITLGLELVVRDTT